MVRFNHLIRCVRARDVDGSAPERTALDASWATLPEGSSTTAIR